MKKLTIDFETRSVCDLKKRGAWVYSEDLTTDVLCMSVRWKNGSKIWINSDIFQLPDPRLIGIPVLKTEDIPKMLEWADTIEAHNAEFELALWMNVCIKRYGWPDLPVEKLRCSAAKAAMHALPRALGEACKVLNLSQQKDAEGQKIMMRMCKPRRINNKDREEWLKPYTHFIELEKENCFYHEPSGKKVYFWHNRPEDFIKLCRYCDQDTLAEQTLSEALRDLPDKELDIWRLNLKMNARGIYADLNSAQKIIGIITQYEAALKKKLRKATNGAVKTVKQVDAFLTYLRGLGLLDLPDLQAATVKATLAREDLSPQARELLELRQNLGRSSSAKYKSIIARSSEDNRIRGATFYHGASTGRMAGAGIQPHNFPSRIKISDSPEKMLEVLMTGGLELFETLYQDDLMSATGMITRSILCAPPGKELFVADYSAIEGRGVAWLAGEESKLEIFRSERDPYIVTAANILHKRYEDVTDEERSHLGKVAELACGYQGSVNAVRKFGGEGMTDDEIKETIVWPWRDAHPQIVKMWGDLETTAFDAVANPGRIYSYRGMSYVVWKGFLCCRLPSGRILYYFDPQIREYEMPWGDMKDCVSYMTIDGYTRKWVRAKSYGGKWTENNTQAVCRDIMTESMLRVDAAGYDLVLTVHDELVAEVEKDTRDLKEYERLMCVVPEWAKGFPIAVKGFKTERYRKG